MKRALAFALTLLVVAFVAFSTGAWWTHRQAASTASARKILHYSCPMHPQYTLDHEGDCPSCGMRLEPVYEGQSGPASAGRPANAIQVSPRRQQAIGVSLGVVESLSGLQQLRTTGRIAPDENAVYPLVAGAEGWVRKLHGATTGSLVKKNEVLLSFYAPEIIVAQQTYYAGLDTVGRVEANQLQAFNNARVAEGVERQANELRNLGVSDAQLQEMARKRELTQDIHVLSPVNGFVLQRNASAGLRFDRGFEFFRIADLSRVWILADVYENQLPFIRVGSRARVTSRDQNRVFEATVTRAEPTFDESTRTLKLRLETENPGFHLKPGMFVDVEFQSEFPEALTVPADAIIDSGLRKTVFVDLGDGYFEPRRVETGWRVGERIQVLKGLMAGERVVISGNFLLDSESRMKSAAMGVHQPEPDLVCGMEVDRQAATAAGRSLTHKGTTYYFCSDDCKKKFGADPAHYLASPHEHASSPVPAKPAPTAKRMAGASPASSDTRSTVKDLVCGMEVDPKDPEVAARRVDHGGKAYYFCSDDCRDQFKANPGKFVK